MPAITRAKLLVVDDEAEIREIIEAAAAHEGFDVLEASDGAQALDVVRNHTVDVVLSDLMMPRSTGIQLLTEMRAAGFMVPFIIVTGYPTQETTLQALRLGAFDYLEKPFESERLLSLLKEALRVSRELERLGARTLTARDGTQAGAEALAAIQKLRTLRYADDVAASDAAALSQEKLFDLLQAEAMPQLLFCDGAIRGLGDTDNRAFELGYLLRVMQSLHTAGTAIGAKKVAELAEAAARFYAALRLRPRTVTDETIELARSANTALQQLLVGGGQVAAVASSYDELLGALAKLSDDGVERQKPAA